MSNTKQDRDALARVIAIVTEAVPEATEILVMTSDQNEGYGFWLDEILVCEDRVSLEEEELFERLSDQIADVLMDVEWDGVMGEDNKGNASIEID